MPEYNPETVEDLDMIGLEGCEEEIEDEEADIPESLSKVLGWAESKENILAQLSDADKQEILLQVSGQYESDYSSMDDWRKLYTKAMKLAKMQHKEQGDKGFPFQGASKAMLPYVMEAAIDFNARFSMEVLSAKNPARFEIVGPETDEKEERAERCSDYVNAELSKYMRWKRETDKETMVLAIAGTTYKKVFFNPATESFESRFTLPDQVVFDHGAPSFEDALQVTHDGVIFTKNDVAGAIAAGLWQYDLDKFPEGGASIAGREYHFLYDLDGDGYCEPYIAVTVGDDEDLVSLVAAFDAEDVSLFEGKVTGIDRRRTFSQKVLIQDPEGGPMGVGWGILFSDIYATINTNLQQLVDAGTLANAAGNSGLIASNLAPAGSNRMQKGSIGIEMGKFTSVQVSSSMTLRDSVMQLPAQGPNQTLFALLQHLENGVRSITTAAYNTEANANEAASLYLARLQQSLKTPNSIILRVMDGIQDEFRLLCDLIYRYGTDERYNNILDGDFSVRDDFNPDDCDILATADLSHGSDVERMARAQVVLDTAINPAAQGTVNVREAYRMYYQAQGLESADIDALMPELPQGPSQQEQIMMQYQAADMEFRDRDMRLKEEKLLMDRNRFMIEAQRDAAELELKAGKSNSDIDLNAAKTAKALAEAARIGVDQSMSILEGFDRRYQQTVGADATDGYNDRRNAGMGRQPGNQALPDGAERYAGSSEEPVRES